MIISSNYPSIDLVEKDIFSFLFHRDDRPFPDTKGFVDVPTLPYHADF
jgi:hypothetical protein